MKRVGKRLIVSTNVHLASRMVGSLACTAMGVPGAGWDVPYPACREGEGRKSEAWWGKSSGGRAHLESLPVHNLGLGREKVEGIM